MPETRSSTTADAIAVLTNSLTEISLRMQSMEVRMQQQHESIQRNTTNIDKILSLHESIQHRVQVMSSERKLEKRSVDSALLLPNPPGPSMIANSRNTHQLQIANNMITPESSDADAPGRFPRIDVSFFAGDDIDSSKKAIAESGLSIAKVKPTEPAFQGTARQAQTKGDEIATMMNDFQLNKSLFVGLRLQFKAREVDSCMNEYLERVETLERKVYALTKYQCISTVCENAYKKNLSGFDICFILPPKKPPDEVRTMYTDGVVSKTLTAPIQSYNYLEKYLFHKAVKLFEVLSTHVVLLYWDIGEIETIVLFVEEFVMEQHIPPYLFAFAVGGLGFHEVGPRTRVYAEAGTELLERAAKEFERTEDMIRQGERLFGNYVWERFDLLVLTLSFLYGGDGSRAQVVAHELAHSWTGNLITNKTNERFWLNEGVTTYAERRIVEAVQGPDRASLNIGTGDGEG